VVKTTVARGYGAQHKALRRSWERKVKAGGVECARCRKPIVPGTPWDLGHSDVDRSVYTGPEHQKCNRSTASRRRLRHGVCVDDPARGVFWGPPDMRGNQRRWSRAWFEWRQPTIAN
jgi:hypothetical protein